MSATKKQVNDLENVVVILEERLEKMEEEQHLLKQMISMQSTLIDNLQMMVKMMSVSASPVTSSYRVMHVGGKQDGVAAPCEDPNDCQFDLAENIKSPPSLKSMTSLKKRMSRVA